MASRSYTIRKGVNGIYTRMEFGETVVSSSDTLTLSGFSNAANGIWRVVLWKKSDGAVMDITYATNIVTLDAGALANIPCIYMAYGVKA